MLVFTILVSVYSTTPPSCLSLRSVCLYAPLISPTYESLYTCINNSSTYYALYIDVLQLLSKVLFSHCIPVPALFDASRTLPFGDDVSSNNITVPYTNSFCHVTVTVRLLFEIVCTRIACGTSAKSNLRNSSVCNSSVCFISLSLTSIHLTLVSLPR